MVLKVFNQHQELTETYTDDKYIITKLLGVLFNKTIVKTKWTTKITYKYNYSNKQTVTVYQNNGYKLEFSEIPTTSSSLDEGVIEQILKEGGNA